ncbi:4-(cytidine 5'-diphospho)-2-C-methyl-D-erythritol kinase [candidate division KSB1 bacterium]|nr:4-(cytidine 5'-diphospho)-2-C-methyl-D-erythritol kinase [candidate division KSB1 bacterium]
MSNMHWRAFAKINLGLWVLYKRPDGFHEIETIFQQISLHDTLRFTPRSRGILLHCDPPVLPTDERNLVVRAAALLQRRTNTAAGCAIHLNKVIPKGAGLGGGSSDGATTLKALNQLWALNLPQTRLLEIAAELGSDVPFFIRGGSAIGSGRGEVLQPITIPTGYWGVLVYPNLSISTRWVYENGNFDLTKTLKNSKFYGLANHIDSLADWQSHLQNDLQVVVFNKYPFLQLILEQLKQMGAFFTGMSGSGSSLFGLFTHRRQALQAMEQVNKEYTQFLFHPLTEES